MGFIKNTFYAGVGAILVWLWFTRFKKEKLPMIPQPNIEIKSINRDFNVIIGNVYILTLFNRSNRKTEKAFWYIVDGKTGQTILEKSEIIFQPNEELAFDGIVLNQNNGYTFVSGHNQCIDDQQQFNT